MGRSKAPERMKYNSTITIWINKSDRELVRLTASALGTTGSEYMLASVKKSLKKDQDVVATYLKKIVGE